MSKHNILCTLCKTVLKKQDEIYSTSCGHIFHFICMRECQTRSSSCPECKHFNPITHKMYLFFNENLNENAPANDSDNLKIVELQNDIEENKSAYIELQEKYVVSLDSIRKLEDRLKISNRSISQRAEVLSELEERIKTLEELNQYLTIDNECKDKALKSKINEISDLQNSLKDIEENARSLASNDGNQMKKIERKLENLTTQLNNEIATSTILSIDNKKLQKFIELMKLGQNGGTVTKNDPYEEGVHTSSKSNKVNIKDGADNKNYASKNFENLVENASNDNLINVNSSDSVSENAISYNSNSEGEFNSSTDHSTQSKVVSQHNPNHPVANKKLIEHILVSKQNAPENKTDNKIIPQTPIEKNCLIPKCTQNELSSSTAPPTNNVKGSTDILPPRKVLPQNTIESLKPNSTQEDVCASTDPCTTKTGKGINNTVPDSSKTILQSPAENNSLKQIGNQKTSGQKFRSTDEAANKTEEINNVALISKSLPCSHISTTLQNPLQNNTLKQISTKDDSSSSINLSTNQNNTTTTLPAQNRQEISSTLLNVKGNNKTNQEISNSKQTQHALKPILLIENFSKNDIIYPLINTITLFVFTKEGHISSEDVTKILIKDRNGKKHHQLPNKITLVVEFKNDDLKTKFLLNKVQINQKYPSVKLIETNNQKDVAPVIDQQNKKKISETVTTNEKIVAADGALKTPLNELNSSNILIIKNFPKQKLQSSLKNCIASLTSSTEGLIFGNDVNKVHIKEGNLKKRHLLPEKITLIVEFKNSDIKQKFLLNRLQIYKIFPLIELIDNITDITALSDTILNSKETIPLAAKTDAQKTSASDSKLNSSTNSSLLINNFPKTKIQYPLKKLTVSLASSKEGKKLISIDDISKCHIKNHQGKKHQQLPEKISLFVEFKNSDIKKKFLLNQIQIQQKYPSVELSEINNSIDSDKKTRQQNSLDLTTNTSTETKIPDKVIESKQNEQKEAGLSENTSFATLPDKIITPFNSSANLPDAKKIEQIPAENKQQKSDNSARSTATPSDNSIPQAVKITNGIELKSNLVNLSTATKEFATTNEINNSNYQNIREGSSSSLGSIAAASTKNNLIEQIPAVNEQQQSSISFARSTATTSTHNNILPAINTTNWTDLNPNSVNLSTSKLTTKEFAATSVINNGNYLNWRERSSSSVRSFGAPSEINSGNYSNWRDRSSSSVSSNAAASTNANLAAQNKKWNDLKPHEQRSNHDNFSKCPLAKTTTNEYGFVDENYYQNPFRQQPRSASLARTTSQSSISSAFGNATEGERNNYQNPFRQQPRSGLLAKTTSQSNISSAGEKYNRNNQIPFKQQPRSASLARTTSHSNISLAIRNTTVGEKYNRTPQNPFRQPDSSLARATSNSNISAAVRNNPFRQQPKNISLARSTSHSNISSAGRNAKKNDFKPHKHESNSINTRKSNSKPKFDNQKKSNRPGQRQRSASLTRNPASTSNNVTAAIKTSNFPATGTSQEIAASVFLLNQKYTLPYRHRPTTPAAMVNTFATPISLAVLTTTEDLLIYAKEKLRGNGFEFIFRQNNDVMALKDRNDSKGIKIMSINHVNELLESKQQK